MCVAIVLGHRTLVVADLSIAWSAVACGRRVDMAGIPRGADSDQEAGDEDDRKLVYGRRSELTCVDHSAANLLRGAGPVRRDDRFCLHRYSARVVVGKERSTARDLLVLQ